MEDEEQGLDLGRYLGVLLHWWWVIGLAVVVLAAAGYGYSRATNQQQPCTPPRPPS